MAERIDLCVLVVIFMFGHTLPDPMSKLPECDQSHADYIHEGNIGQSENFPWLGILRVHLHEFNELKIAVTGLVLVKEQYAIANADDINRIPKLVFMQDSKAMFIPKSGEPWFSKPKDYMIHPEFEFSTYNTIALVELELEERTQVPFKPVCWPGNFFNTSNQLYALGYTDENKLMEKTVYTLQYVKPSLCKEFYNRAGFTEPKSAPTSIQCGFAANNKNDCAWENGMALVSNSSGKWTLIGFGVRGPGCAAPARFIDMSSYLPWVESATDLEQIIDYPDYRRKTAFNVGFTRTGISAKMSTSTERPVVFQEVYPGMGPHGPGDFKIYSLDRGQSYWFEMPSHLEEAGFLSADRCFVPKVMVYRERMRLVDTYETGGMLEYRVTVYDRHIFNYTCMKVKIRNAISCNPVKVWFRHDIDLLEGTGFNGGDGDTPSDILKYFPLPAKFEPIEEATSEEAPWKPGKHLEAKFLTDRADHSRVGNINVIIGFIFSGNATMDVFIYGYPHRQLTRTTTTTTTEPDVTTENRRTINHEEHVNKSPRKKRKNRFEKARERAAERKARLASRAMLS